MSQVKQPVDPIGSAVGASRRSRMSQTEIATMLGCCARIPSVFLAARHRLDFSMFDRTEAKFALLWRATVAAADSNRGVIPSDQAAAKHLITIKCAAEIATDTNRLFYTPTVEQAVLGDAALLDEIFIMPVGDVFENQGLSLLAQFVVERTISDPLRLALAGIGPQDTISDPTAIMAAIEKHTREIAGIGVDPGSEAVLDDDNYLPPGPAMFTTNLPWLDYLMGGGQAKQECYALLGPTSGGKSAKALQIAVEGAILQNSIAAETPEEAGHWYVFTYELSLAQIRPRIYQYGAKIHADTFNERQPLSTCEQPETMKEYEYDPYVNSPGNPTTGEKERLFKFRKKMSGINSRLHVIDYSGTHPGLGLGGIEEISAYLRRQEAAGRKTTGIIIDYAGICVNRYIASRRLRPESEYPLLAGFVDAVRSQICVAMNCTAWVLHQLHGEVTKRAPGAKVHHSDARGCRNFADNSDFGLQLANYDKNTGLLTVHCTKHRRARGREDGAIARFRGEFGAFVSPDGEYEVDAVTRQIVPKGYTDMLKPRQPTRRAPGKSAGPIDPTAGIV